MFAEAAESFLPRSPRFCGCFCVCRVCELEGKVRELESSMSRMGAQHDVNMELIGTFRHQKETVSARASQLMMQCGVVW